MEGTRCREECSIVGCLDCYNSTSCELCEAFSSLTGDRKGCGCDEGYRREGGQGAYVLGGEWAAGWGVAVVVLGLVVGLGM